MFENIEKKDGEMKNKRKKKNIWFIFVFIYIASEIIFILFFSLI